MKVRTNSIIIIISFIISLSDCSRSTSKNDILEEIDIESNFNSFKELQLSQLNAEIKYLPLKRDGNFELNQIMNIDVKSDLILISNISLCLLYDTNGSLIRKIGNKGRGPYEYSIITNSGFGQKNNIYLQNIDNFLEYGTDGTLLSSFLIKKVNNPEFQISSWILINDSLFLGHTPLTTGKDSTKAILFNKQGFISHQYRNYIFLNRPIRMFTSDDSEVSFYTYQEGTFFKEKMNDTLFYLNEMFTLIPRLSFKLGKYSMPKEYRERVTHGEDPPYWFNYIFVNNIFEISDYLLLDCPFNKYMPAKRFTPREVAGVNIWYNTLDVLGLYDKKKRSLSFCKPTSTDNPLFTSGLYNDIDAGPRFYPIKQVNDSTLVMWIDPKQLKDHVASDDFKSNNPKYPEKKIELERMVKNISEYDNPILMLVTFKSK